ncbi:MAG: trpD [Magnetococcales bacterium]|nr:trpD [Magnetococcales bacterium]
MNIRTAIAQLLERQDLPQEEARQVMQQIMSGETTPAQIAAYVIALRMKGETVEELTGSAQAMRERALKVQALVTPLIDTCGTGGTDVALLIFLPPQLLWWRPAASPSPNMATGRYLPDAVLLICSRHWGSTWMWVWRLWNAVSGKSGSGFCSPPIIMEP